MVGFEGTEVPRELEAFVEEDPPAGIILFRRNVTSTAQVAELTRALRALWPSGAPTPLIGLDQEGGKVRRLRSPACPEVLDLPAARAIARARDPTLTEELAWVAAVQMTALGFNLDFAPVLDVDSNPANPVIGERAFSRDPEEVAAHGLAFAEGLRRGGLIPCGKHFPGHGDTDLDSHVALPLLAATTHDLARLRAVELEPFRQAIEAGLEAMMSAHIVFAALDPELPGTLSPHVLPPLLREELGFEGVLFSDDLEMAAIAEHHDATSIAARGLEATIDVFLVCHRLGRARALRDALGEEARRDPLQARRSAVAHRRVRALRERAADPAAGPWGGQVPLEREGSALLALLELA